MTSYIGLIHKDPDSDYGVSFPDFPGCITAGASLDEARAMAEEALALHIEGIAEDGEAIPKPSSLETIMRVRENRDAVALVVPVKPAAATVVRVNVTLPADVLAAIDRYAAAAGFTRSGFLVQAARKALPQDR